MSHTVVAAHRFVSTLSNGLVLGFGAEYVRGRISSAWARCRGTGGAALARISRVSGENSIFGPVRPVGTDEEDGRRDERGIVSLREPYEGDLASPPGRRG
jgi:hypothetical protein